MSERSSSDLLFEDLNYECTDSQNMTSQTQLHLDGVKSFLSCPTSSRDLAMETELVEQVRTWLDGLVASASLERLSTNLEMLTDLIETTLNSDLLHHPGFVCQLLLVTFSFFQKCEEHLASDLMASVQEALFQIFQLGVSLQKKLVSVVGPAAAVEKRLEVAASIPALAQVAAALDLSLGLALWKAFIKLSLSLRDQNFDASAALDPLGHTLQLLLSSLDQDHARALDFLLQVASLVLKQQASALPPSLLSALLDLCSPTEAGQLTEVLGSGNFTALTSVLAAHPTFVSDLAGKLESLKDSSVPAFCLLASRICSHLGDFSRSGGEEELGREREEELLHLMYATLQTMGRGKCWMVYSQVLEGLQSGAVAVSAPLFYLLEQMLLECLFSKLQPTQLLARDMWVSVLREAGSQELVLQHCLLISSAASALPGPVPAAPLSCLASLLALLQHERSYWRQFTSFFHPDLWLYLAPSSADIENLQVGCEEVVECLRKLGPPHPKSGEEQMTSVWWLAEALGVCCPRPSAADLMALTSKLAQHQCHWPLQDLAVAAFLRSALSTGMTVHHHLCSLASFPSISADTPALAIPCLAILNQLVKLASESQVLALLKKLSPSQKAFFEAFLTAEAQEMESDPELAMAAMF